MKYIPILFSTPMVQAILEGRKTMTRRIIKPQPVKLNQGPFGGTAGFHPEDWSWPANLAGCSTVSCKPNGPADYVKEMCKYQKGDALWVREKWQHWLNDFGYPSGVFMYSDDERNGIGWKPSIHMPKVACRIFLEVTDVRVERLHQITEEDSILEGAVFTDNGIHDSWPKYITKEQAKATGGLKGCWSHTGETDPGRCLSTARSSFGNLWEKINGHESWKSNPWVWVVSFKRIDKPENFK